MRPHLKKLSPRFVQCILDATGANSLGAPDIIQSLWSGYGEILRVPLLGASVPTVVVKHVQLSKGESGLSHQRKLRSYQVEVHWYKEYAGRCGEQCRVPHCLAVDAEGDEVLLVLEDLDRAGFDGRRHMLAQGGIAACLAWLANFHATFMGQAPDGLWEVGTYWHLETRPEELDDMDDPPLRQAAADIDRSLTDARYRTLVHGDAKVANFCFSRTSGEVAAVDFQYVGGGVGMKDVAYFVGSCLHEVDCANMEGELLGIYFDALHGALAEKQPGVDAQAVEAEWRGLYPLAWTDFHRFIKGWSPGAWAKSSYSETVKRQVLASFEREMNGLE